MTIVEIMTCALIVFLMISILVCLIFNLRETAKKNEGMLKVQIEAAKVKGVDHITKMSFDDATKILHHLIGFYVSNAILVNGLLSKDSDQLSTVMDDLLTKICTDVKMSMSEPLKTSFLNYVTDDYLNIMIKDTSRLVLTAKINERRR